jgi:hypothetical protein
VFVCIYILFRILINLVSQHDVLIGGTINIFLFEFEIDKINTENVELRSCE